MKKVLSHLGFSLAVLALLAPNAWCTPLRTPDAASTSALLGVACVGLAGLRKFFRR